MPFPVYHSSPLIRSICITTHRYLVWEHGYYGLRSFFGGTRIRVGWATKARGFTGRVADAYHYYRAPVRVRERRRNYRRGNYGTILPYAAVEWDERKNRCGRQLRGRYPHRAPHRDVTPGADVAGRRQHRCACLGPETVCRGSARERPVAAAICRCVVCAAGRTLPPPSRHFVVCVSRVLAPVCVCVCTVRV